MSARVTDLHIARNVPLPSPARLQAEIPRGEERIGIESFSKAQTPFGSGGASRKPLSLVRRGLGANALAR